MPDGYTQTLVVNAETSSLTTYSGYGFNSMFHFAGATFAADGTGVHRLDDGAPVRGRFSTGLIDFGNSAQKRMQMLYAGVRAPKPITLTVTADEGDPVALEISGGAAQIEQRRVKPAKGQRGKYWKFAFEGDDFALTSFSIDADLLSRRV